MPRADSTAALLSAVAGELLAERDESRLALAVVARAVELVADADEASLSTVHLARGRARWTHLAATSRAAETADLLQHRTTAGMPEEEPWVRSGDLGSDDRRSAWGPQAAELGLCSVLAVRLTFAGEPSGVLSLWARRPGAFVDPAVVDVATAYSAHVGHALALGRLVTGLETALGSRHAIGIAQGILMERYGLGQEQSFSYLSRLSSQHNRKLRDLAAEIGSTRTVPEAPSSEVLDT
jgi:hypothetical protein